MIEEIKKYFTHQSEIYGEDFYFEPDILISKVTEPPGNPHVVKDNLESATKSQSDNSLVKEGLGSGPLDAKLMCVGNQLGKQVEIKWDPFAGDAGELLEKILTAIKFSKDDVYVASNTNDARKNIKSGAASITDFFKHKIEEVKPIVILALGKTAAQSLLGNSDSVADLRQKENRFNGIPVFVTHHPDELLQNPELKRTTWEDVQKLRKVFDSLDN